MHLTRWCEKCRLTIFVCLFYFIFLAFSQVKNLQYSVIKSNKKKKLCFPFGSPSASCVTTDTNTHTNAYIYSELFQRNDISGIWWWISKGHTRSATQSRCRQLYTATAGGRCEEKRSDKGHVCVGEGWSDVCWAALNVSRDEPQISICVRELVAVVSLLPRTHWCKPF